MNCGLAPLARLAVQGTLGLYYHHASHRTMPPPPTDLPPAQAEGRPLHFFRGMMRFEPGTPFLRTLAREGFEPRVFRFAPGVENDPFRSLWEDSADVVDFFIDHPPAIGTRPVFVGHSAGGFTSYLLASIAKGGSYRGIRRALPRLQPRGDHEFEQLAFRLRGGRFIAIAVPFQGIGLTGVGELLNRRVIEPRAPRLFSSVTREALEGIYRNVRKDPGNVMDGVIYSASAPFEMEGDIASRATTAAIQGALRLFARFADDRGPTDGIVPVDSVDPYREVFEATPAMNHLRLVETEEAAMTLVGMIRTLG